EGFEKQVVIKRIRPPLADDPSFVEMFIAEARVASKLNHANIVHIFDFDQHQDTYYLAMEYVRGKSLAEVHRRARPPGRGVPAAPHRGAELSAGPCRAGGTGGGPRPGLRPPAPRPWTAAGAGAP